MSYDDLAFAPSAVTDVLAVIDCSDYEDVPHEVEVYSTARALRLARFPVAWELGSGLAVTGGTRPLVITADDVAVTAYDLRGRRRWRRNLAGVTTLRAHGEGDDATVAIAFDDAPLTVVAARTGVTRARLRGVRDLFRGVAGLEIHDLGDAVRIGSGPRSPRIARGGLALLDAASSPDTIVLSEAGGALRAFALDGKARWERRFGETSHALAVAWSVTQACWLAVVWRYTTDGPRWLYRLDAAGRVLDRRQLARRGGPDSAEAFSRNGDAIALHDGRRLRVLDPVAGRRRRP